MRVVQRDWWTRLEMWWGLEGQFSWPVRMLSSRRRRAYTRVNELLADPGFQRRSLERIAARIRKRRTVREDTTERMRRELESLTEAELFERIFGYPWEPRP